MRRISAQRLYGGIVAWGVLFVFLIWWYFVSWPVLIVYLCAVNVVTLFLYAFDKFIAGSHVTRVPEVVLHGLALLGGSLITLVGQRVFRHKTRKTSFKTWQYGVIVLQVVLVVLYLYTR